MTPPPYALGVDTEETGLRAADHLLLDLAARLGLPEDVFGCTHLVRDGGPRRVALSLAAADAAVLDAARAALTDQGYAVTDGAPDRSGRAVLYPGAARLTGTLTVAELLERSAIERVRVLGTPGPADPGLHLVTREFVRPQWEDGVLVLAAMPHAGGTLVPFEDPDPTPCCADH
ncbi:hypothetical protein [Streptomyces fumanus]|uniref:Uncharacterized protein n=1 Tax=Streptomyces fumanus TaxID=67302 RepID=A0A919AJR0_9ACTN|nr:hypothetical protein [Streptomyces fumanus]GHF11281.1 hypothetical protein GCM10018772_40450 [Streptomyces fumanus]